MALSERVEESLAASRRDRLIFVLGGVALTPLLLLGAVAGLLFAVWYADLPFFDHLPFRYGLATGMNVFLLYMFVIFFINPDDRRASPLRKLVTVGTAMGLMLLLLLLSYGTPLSARAPGAFWTMYGLVVLAILGLLGGAYQPRDDYYLGWFGGWMGDPFTIEDDLDRGHLALGCAVMFPAALLDIYGEIFSGWSLLVPLTEAERLAAAEVIREIDAGNPRRPLERLDRHSAARVVRALVKADLVRLSKDKLVLARDGEKLLRGVPLGEE